MNISAALGPIVALHGLPGAGKDTIADMMVSRHGFQKMAFADALYRDVAHAFGVTESFLRDRGTKTVPTEALSIYNTGNHDYRKYLAGRGEDIHSPRTSRYHLDRYGTDYMRRIDPMHWVRTLTSALDQDHSQRVVVSDLRAYSDFREYVGLRRFSSYSGRSLTVVRLTREGAAAPDDHEAHTRLPAHAIDLEVQNLAGAPESALTAILKQVSA